MRIGIVGIPSKMYYGWNIGTAGGLVNECGLKM